MNNKLQEEKPKPSAPVDIRANVRKTLTASLFKRSKDADLQFNEEYVKNLSEEIEYELYKEFNKVILINTLVSL